MTSDFEDWYPKSYHGRIYIYLGNLGLGIRPNSTPDFIIEAGNETHDMSSMGLKLRSSDCNGDGFKDLLILSPLAE
jgi:hypothetical protein